MNKKEYRLDKINKAMFEFKEACEESRALVRELRECIEKNTKYIKSALKSKKSLDK